MKRYFEGFSASQGTSNQEPSGRVFLPLPSMQLWNSPASKAKVSNSKSKGRAATFHLTGLCSWIHLPMWAFPFLLECRPEQPTESPLYASLLRFYITTFSTFMLRPSSHHHTQFHWAISPADSGQVNTNLPVTLISCRDKTKTYALQTFYITFWKKTPNLATSIPETRLEFDSNLKVLLSKREAGNSQVSSGSAAIGHCRPSPLLHSQMCPAERSIHFRSCVGNTSQESYHMWHETENDWLLQNTRMNACCQVIPVRLTILHAMLEAPSVAISIGPSSCSLTAR